ncbi:TniQ family protein [Streptomyces scopuliridis]|uniref:TniQ family protein n=1 Tax=Streptomyces scopuliridis TaxID=452529 RepID=UPI0036D1BB5F
MSKPTRAQAEDDLRSRLDHLTLSRKEGFARLADAPRRIRPELLSHRELKELSEEAAAEYNRARRQWHANLGPLGTPQMNDLHEDLWDIFNSNDQDSDKVKGGIALDAFPGLGKTTAVLAFARKLHRRVIKEEGKYTDAGHERWPVCRVGLTSNTGMRDFNRAVLEYFGHPGRHRGTAADFGYRALDCVLSAETKLLIVDDLHFLRWRNTSGIEVSNHFKYIANEFPVTLLMVGVGLEKRGLFSEGATYEDGVLAQTGRRTTRLGMASVRHQERAGAPRLARHPPCDRGTRHPRKQVPRHDRGRLVRLSLRPQHRTHRLTHDVDQPRLSESRTHRRGAAGRRPAEQCQERRCFREGPSGAGAGLRDGQTDQSPQVLQDGRMTDMLRTLPIRVAPLPGEALDSWLEALAQRLRTPLGDVTRNIGLPPRHKAGRRLPGTPVDWTVMLGPQQKAAISMTTGVDEARLQAMTLQRYDQRALKIDHEHHAVQLTVLWGRGSGSRFCPDCLAENGGRWMLFWRLGWAFACPRHHRMLADCCPRCGRIPRRRPRSLRSVPDPLRCGNTPFRKDGAITSGCGFDLTATDSLHLSADHPSITAQRLLIDVIEQDTADFGTYALAPQPASSALTDIRVISGRVLSLLPDEDLPRWASADVADAHLHPAPDHLLASRAEHRPGFIAPPRAVTTATAVTAALHVLNQPDIHQAGAALRPLRTIREDEEQISPSTISGWGRWISPVLEGIHLASLAPSSRPGDHLRHRMLTEVPRFPSKSSADIAMRSRTIPSTFWGSWAVRLAPPDETITLRVLAPALAACLLIVGSRIDFETSAHRLGDVIDNNDLSRVLQRLDDDPCWPGIVTALVRLADHLDAVDVPIDYACRRDLDYSRLLPTEQWTSICRRTGTPPGKGLREQIMRCHLFQRISGSPIEAAPGHPGTRHSEFRTDSVYDTALRTPELARALDEHAREFLAEHGIHDEPVTWQPPTSLLNGLALPGPDRDRIDLSLLHRLVRQRKHPVRQAAETLGISIETVRQLLDEQPAPMPSLTKTQLQARGMTTAKAMEALPKSELARHYLEEYRSFQQIADITGFSRQTLIRLAHVYGIPLRDGPQDYNRAGTVDRDWLFEQYVNQRRALPDLAREKGMSVASMTRWAHRHGVPLRPRGGRSHRSALHSAEAGVRHPEILREAFTGRHAEQRLRRFARCLAYPTLTEAAQDMGIHPPVLINQVRLLEQDLGQPLLKRAECNRAMQATEFGQQVADAVEEMDTAAGIGPVDN